MKKIFKSLSGVGMLILGLIAGIGVTGYSFAQEGDSVLVQKIDALVEQLANLAGNNIESSSNSSGYTVQTSVAGGVVGYNKNPSCVDDYMGWPTSTTRNNSNEWDLKFIPFESTYVPNHKKDQFLDLNGDGLIDYLYAHKETTSNRQYEYSCVYLNNGDGWDEAYKCVYVQGSQNSFSFYGDCAQL